MAFTTKVRFWWEVYRCSPGTKRPEGFFGRHPTYEQYVAHDAVSALEQGHLGAGYVPENDGYIGSKRWCPHGIAGATCQPSGSGCSIHNYVVAYDIEYNYNKHIRARTYPEDFAEWWFPAVCKYTVTQVRAIEGIRNLDGEQLWKWLGWSIGDFMHWQINVPPERCEVDWNTVPGWEVDERVTTKVPDTWAKDSWDKAIAAGAISSFSVPSKTVSAQALMVFLDRLGLLDRSLGLDVEYVQVVKGIK